MSSIISMSRLAATVAMSAIVAGSAVTAAYAQGPKPAAPAAPAAPAQEYATSWDQYMALKAAAHGGTKLTPNTVPDWTGVWERVMRSPFALDPKAKPIPGGPYVELTAPLTPKYKAAYDKKMKEIENGTEWDRISWCLPSGFPRWLAEPFLREFIVTPNETWMTHEQVNETRRIYTDGRAHTQEEDPLWMGESIGFWDGDTLIVHTDHIKAGQYQRGNPDYSFHTSTVEKIRQVSPGLIEDDFTVYDPDSLTRPWHLVYSYRKVPGDVRIRYDACEENNNTYRAADGSTQERKRTDPLFRDYRTFGIPEVAWDSIPK